MTPANMAAIHRTAFTRERPWSADEIEALIASKYVEVFSATGGFALARTLAGESELLTFAVDPAHQQLGIGRQLCIDWLTAASQTAKTAFLEVAADNTPALRLYTSLNFAKAGLRKGYYARKDAPSADALLLQLDLTHGHHPKSLPESYKSG